MERADEIARLETLHNGKPIFESRQIEMPAAAECFQYFAGWADKIHGETIPVKGNYLTYTLREPVGVVAAIVPWNFPLLLTAWKVAPALACGNTVIIKPASQTPLTALALAEIAHDVGLPPGVLNVVTGPGSTVGQMLVEHPGHRQDRVHRRHVHRQGHHARRRRDVEEASRSSSAASRRTSSSPTPTSTPPSAARRPASSTARAKSAPPDRGCWSTNRSRTSSSTRWPRARRRWRRAIRSIRRRAWGRSRRRSSSRPICATSRLRRRKARSSWPAARAPTSARARATSCSRRSSTASRPR